MSQRLALLLLLALSFWWRLSPAVPAWGHSELLAADPAPGAQLAASPATIRLVFTAPLKPLSTLLVYGAQFQSIPGITPVITPTNPQHMMAALPSLAPGVYTVQWRAISTDNDLVTGSYQFVVVGHTGHNGHMLAISVVAVLFLSLVSWIGLVKWQRGQGFYRSKG